MTFLAFDFETANYSPDSACSIGVVRVERDQVIRAEAFLIRPPTTQFVFTGIHGLTWSHVAKAPTFGELWSQGLADWFRGVDFVVAHNVRFDLRVLEACCDRYGLELPPVSFECSVELAKKVLGIRPANLKNVCEVLSIPLNHHEALSDAKACAEITVRALAIQRERLTAAPSARYTQE
jgi:DNA polymerase-3 subunit epsilon